MVLIQRILEDLMKDSHCGSKDPQRSYDRFTLWVLERILVDDVTKLHTADILRTIYIENHHGCQ